MMNKMSKKANQQENKIENTLEKYIEEKPQKPIETQAAQKTSKTTVKIERKILLISFIMGLILAVTELFASIVTGSQSMLMDAAYDATELIAVVLLLFLTPLFHQPLSEKRPFGYSQVESVFIVIKNVMMLSVTIGLLGDTVEILLHGGNVINSSFVAQFQLVLGSVSVIVFCCMKKLNNSITSPIIDLELYSWKIDIFYSLGMACAFFMATLLKNTAFSAVIPYFDQIVAILIVIFMMPQVIKMLIISLKNMFLFSPDAQTIDTVKNIAGGILEKFQYNVETCDIYKTGRVLWVDVYITVESEQLLVADYAQASVSLQEQLSVQLENCYSQLILQNHLSPKID